jgi:integrase
MSAPNVHGLPQFLRKDKAGYFLDFSLREGGKRVRKRVRLGLIPFVQAKKILAEHMQEIASGRFLTNEQPEPTFNEAADSFLAYSQARKKTFKNDSLVIRRLKEFFGDRPLRNLNADIVEGYLTQRGKAGNIKFPGKPLSNMTLNGELRIIKSILNRAVLNGLLEKNPIQRVRGFKDVSRDRTLTQDEYEALLSRCSSRLAAIVQLAYWTGMRRGEILGLRWDQVDIKNKVITLEAADTKTQEKREVPLTEELIGIIQRTPRTLGNPYVFTHKGQRIKNIKTAFWNAVRGAGIKDFRFHDLRHCAVTNLRKAGVSDSVVMSISGHKTYAMFRRYNRIDREDRLEALNRLARSKDRNRTPIETEGTTN